MVSAGEKEPLISSPSATGKYYFLNNATESNNYQGPHQDADGGEELETLPEGATEDEFAPRQVGLKRHPSQVTSKQPRMNGGKAAAPKPASSSNIVDGGSFWSKLFGRKKPQRKYGEVGTMLKQRKAPVKIEPKVFFANERTFLAWMHLSVILAGASIAILAFAEDQNPLSQLYGVVLLPVSIAFIAYSMYQYARRAKMIRHRHPGPYEDTVGPVVLGIMLMVSIVAQFALKLYNMAS